MQIILFLLVAILAYQNNASLNLTKNQVIIVSLIAYYFLFMQKENFTLSSAIIADNINKDPLLPNTFYDTGVLISGKQIQTVTAARNGGTPCGSFPTRVYRVSTQPANATCTFDGQPIAPGLQPALDANVDGNYSFANSPINTGSAIKGNANL